MHMVQGVHDNLYAYVLVSLDRLCCEAMMTKVTTECTCVIAEVLTWAHSSDMQPKGIRLVGLHA